ncbi:MAG TPA: PAS domain S-box protein [Burkholderiaceae bacterium]|nr:PAS domain S-box protein [Burkholderiaceae bacterium]
MHPANPPTAPSGIDLATLFDAVADSVYLIDPLTSGIVWCNRAGYESLGYQADEILGHSVLSLQKDVTGLPAWQDIASEIRKTNPYVFVGRHRHRLGHEISVEVLTRTFDAGGAQWFLSVARDVTQRMALEADQHSRDEHVRFALNEASDGIWDWHLPSGEVSFSPQLKRMLGYGPHEMAPTVETWTTAVHPDDAASVFQAINQHIQGLRERYEAEYRLRNRNGHFIWVHDRGRMCQRDADGNPVRMVGMVQNITDRKTLELQLQRHASHDALTGLRNRRESEHTLENLVQTCLRLGIPLGVCLFDLDHFKHINDQLGHLAGDRVLSKVSAKVSDCIRSSDSVFRWGGEEFLLLCPGSDQQQMAQFADKLRTEIQTLPWPDVPGLEAVTASFGLASLPTDGVTPRELVLAADAALYRAKGSGRNRVTAHTDSPDSAGTQAPRPVTLATASPALDTRALLAELQRLSQREQHLEQLLNSAPDAVLVMDTNGHITEWNKGAERLLGWKQHEVLGKQVADVLVPPEHRERHRAGLQRFLRERTSTMLTRPVQVESLRKDGSRLPADMSIWPIHQGELVSFGAFMRDNTERKLTQQALELNAERYRQVVENLGEGMGVIQDGVTVYVNPRAAELLERPASAMVGQAFLAWVHPDDHALVADRQRRRQLGEAVPDRYELRCVTGTGQVRWMSTRASALTWEGRPATMTFFTDVTDQRSTLMALQASEKRYRTVVQQLGEGMMVIQKGHVIFANPQAAALLGRTPEELENMHALAVIHPEDRAMVAERLQARDGGNQIDVQTEFRIVWPDGSEHWLNTHSSMAEWEGQPATLTFFADHTQQRHMIEALHRSEERYRLVIEHVGQGMVVVKNDQFVFANARACEVMEMPLQDMLARGYLERIHPEDLGMVQERRRKRLAGEAVPKQYDIRLLMPDGRIKWIDIGVTLVPWDGGVSTLTFFSDITDQRRTTEALHRSEERYRQVIEHVGEGMVVVQGERFAFINTRASEIVEMPIDDMMARGYLERIHPDDHGLVQQRRLKRLAGEPVPNRYEIRLLMPDGRVKWIDIGVTLVPWEGGTATLTFFSDVSERKQLEDRLTSTLAEREIVLNTSVVGIAFLTPDGRFRWANPAMLHLFGGLGRNDFYSMEQVYLNREQYLQVGGEVAQAIRKGQRFQRELQMRKLTGEVFWVTLSGQAVNHQNLLDGTVWTALDITERKQAEEDIRTALAQQRELNDLRTRFVSMTSHEFRTPLATILSSAELLKFYGERMAADERQEVLQSIESGVKRMATMLDSVLMLGRAEAQMMTFDPVEAELGDICQAILDETLQAVSSSACDVSLVLSPGLRPGYLDTTLLRHVFGNLLSNAIKYSPAGGRVVFEVRQDNGHHVLSVSDQGIGIPKDELPHLFSSFHRASNVGDIKGTGLGLAIVKQAVDLHGGHIEVTSDIGKGTCFTVRLPL